MTGDVWTAQRPPFPAAAAAGAPVGRADRWLRVGAALVARAWLYTLAWLAAWVLVPAATLGWTPVTITSGSMLPSIEPGDVLLLEPADGPLDVGRVVTFRDGRRLVSHRVVGMTPDGRYHTRGDANPAADSSPVATAQLEGAARVVVPLVGLPTRWATDGEWGPLGALIGLTVLAAAVSPLRVQRQSSRRSVRVLGGAARAVVVVAGVALVAPSVSAAGFTDSTPSPGTWSADVLDAPTGVSTSYDCGVLGLLNSISVEWTASTDTVDGYRVLRSEDGGALAVVANLETGTSWTDADVSAGTSYRYVVRSVRDSWVSPDTGDNETTIETASLCLL